MYALAFTHGAAIWFAWYWTYPWFDILTHFWGGACVSLGAIWAIQHARRYVPVTLRDARPFVAVVIAIGVIGIVWELYEWVVQAAFGLPLPLNYWADTLLDILMDAMGALFGWFLWYSLGRVKE
jgi:hypothetical protein